MTTVSEKRLLNVLIGFVLLLLLPQAIAQPANYPKVLDLGMNGGQVTLYTPQVDEMENDSVRFRSALAWRNNPGTEPVFGVGWFTARVEIDRTAGRVRPTRLSLLETRFPEGTPNLDQALSRALAAPAGTSGFDFALSDLESSLEMARAEQRAAEKLNTKPPEIIYRDRPALLVTMDGDPVLREIENSPYRAVINTPYPLIFDGRRYYLNAAKDVWYRADEATGPYRFDASPPADIVAMVNPDGDSDAAEAPAEPVTSASAPEIVVRTSPAELIVTEGPAAFVPLVDDLLVLNNSDSDVFLDVTSQEYFIVLSGRWYRAASLNGPWRFEQADQLPAAFANIPQSSDQADSRVYVAGTQESRNAVMDAQVPQTAAVERGQVDVDVEYDGEPQFAPVDGTQDMVYATNTGASVMYTNRIYYLVEDGVWYESASPHGPWEVSVQRPAQVAYIDPTSPVYNVKYVYIYDYTPRVVYVGYTPGYIGSYVYHDTLFYGSGWHYSPWVTATYYYPRPSTWGFHVGYSSWSGWSFGLSWGWGPFSLGWYSGGYWHHHHHWHHRHHGYWGPRGYCPRPVPHHPGRGHGRYAHDDVRGGHRGRRHDNLYADTLQPARVVNTRDKQPRVRPGSRGLGRDKSSLREAPVYALNETVTKSSLREKAAPKPNRAKVSQAKVSQAEISRKQPVARNTRPVSRKQPAMVDRKAPAAAKSATSRKTPVTSKTVTSRKAQVNTKTPLNTKAPVSRKTSPSKVTTRSAPVKMPRVTVTNPQAGKARTQKQAAPQPRSVTPVARMKTSSPKAPSPRAQAPKTRPQKSAAPKGGRPKVKQH